MSLFTRDEQHIRYLGNPVWRRLLLAKFGDRDQMSPEDVLRFLACDDRAKAIMRRDATLWMEFALMRGDSAGKNADDVENKRLVIRKIVDPGIDHFTNYFLCPRFLRNADSTSLHSQLFSDTALHF